MLEIYNGPDQFTWLAQYRDGTLVAEHDGDRIEGRGWLEVDHSQVFSLSLAGADSISHIAHIPPGATPVFFRRRRIVINAETGEIGEKQETVHCIGWKREETGVYLFVFPDNSILLSSDLQAV